ncbi:hypothetical protein IBA8402_33080 [Pseudomonas syringae]
MRNGMLGVAVDLRQVGHFKLERRLGQNTLAAHAPLVAETQAQRVMAVDDHLDGFLEQHNIDLALDLQSHADVVVRQVRVCELIEPDTLLNRSQRKGFLFLRAQIVDQRIHLKAPVCEINWLVSGRRAARHVAGRLPVGGRTKNIEKKIEHPLGDVCRGKLGQLRASGLGVQ